MQSNIGIHANFTDYCSNTFGTFRKIQIDKIETLSKYSWNIRCNCEDNWHRLARLDSLLVVISLLATLLNIASHRFSAFIELYSQQLRAPTKFVLQTSNVRDSFPSRLFRLKLRIWSLLCLTLCSALLVNRAPGEHILQQVKAAKQGSNQTSQQSKSSQARQQLSVKAAKFAHLFIIWTWPCLARTVH